MPASGLNAHELAVLANASEEGVQSAFLQLAPHIRRKLWVGIHNRYRQNSVTNVINDCNTNSLNQRHLAQYVAASSILHCSDGWSYLGRAFICHAFGDNDSSRHMAYYAELRAAMSLLATQGRGIFDRQHIVVDQNMHCTPTSPPPRTGKGTHKMTWLSLQHWAGSKNAAKLLATIVRSEGKPLVEWLDAFAPGDKWWPIGTKWLTSWGLDLRKLSLDEEARNEASYRPTRLSTRKMLNAKETWDAMSSFWQVYEPSTASPFEQLDRYLIRSSLRLAYRIATDRDPTTNRQDFSKRITDAMHILGFDEQKIRRLKLFMTKSSATDPKVIQDAGEGTDVSQQRHHLHVISRASLLLRVATGAAAKLLEGGPYNRSDLEFWWKILGENRGLWGPTNVPTSFAELWDDISAALGDWQTARGRIRGTNYPFAQWHGDQPNVVLKLSECERILLWALWT